MFTTPKCFIPNDPKERAYIVYFYNGKRQREYNGNRLNLNIHPNQFSTLKDKERLLEKLQYEFNKALCSGWNPFAKESELPSLQHALSQVLEDKLNSNLCDLYKRNLKAVVRMFTEWILWPY